jgi:hypothetical protein
MYRTGRVLVVGAAAAGVVAAGAGAASAASGGSTVTAAQHLSQVKQHVDQRAGALNDRASALRRRINTSKTLTAAQKVTIGGEITRLVNDTATAQHQVDAATDIASLKAARPALQTVHADRSELHTDLAAVRAGHKKPA